MATGSTYRITFLNASPAEANMKAADLKTWLRKEVPDHDQLAIDRERTSKDSQDFGATLVLVLGTTAITAVAKGVQAWLAAHTGTRVEITTDNGTVVATNVDAKSAAEMVKAMAGGTKPQ
ncbi:MAG TPA: hypothetical protein VJN96_21545 [Vicinamibacterales bacterium]|nr:hypothetical protein [Vicinamibacterales bacterium]